jgi:hypothetical protein
MPQASKRLEARQNRRREVDPYYERPQTNLHFQDFPDSDTYRAETVPGDLRPCSDLFNPYSSSSSDHREQGESPGNEYTEGTAHSTGLTRNLRDLFRHHPSSFPDQTHLPSSVSSNNEATFFSPTGTLSDPSNPLEPSQNYSDSFDKNTPGLENSASSVDKCLVDLFDQLESQYPDSSSDLYAPIGHSRPFPNDAIGNSLHTARTEYNQFSLSEQSQYLPSSFDLGTQGGIGTSSDVPHIEATDDNNPFPMDTSHDNPTRGKKTTMQSRQEVAKHLNEILQNEEQIRQYTDLTSKEIYQVSEIFEKEHQLAGGQSDSQSLLTEPEQRLLFILAYTKHEGRHSDLGRLLGIWGQSVGVLGRKLLPTLRATVDRMKKAESLRELAQRLDLPLSALESKKADRESKQKPLWQAQVLHFEPDRNEKPNG